MEVKTAWRYTSTPSGAFTIWCFIKHRNHLAYYMLETQHTHNMTHKPNIIYVQSISGSGGRDNIRYGYSQGQGFYFWTGDWINEKGTKPFKGRKDNFIYFVHLLLFSDTVYSKPTQSQWFFNEYEYGALVEWQATKEGKSRHYKNKSLRCHTAHHISHTERTAKYLPLK
jgi:hypothetical protein